MSWQGASFRCLRLTGAALIIVSLSAIGCVTTAPRSRSPSESARVLSDMPVARFTVQECGAGSLAAVLNYLGDQVSRAELEQELPKAANGGVLSLDLLLAARARGFEADLVAGSVEEIERLLARGLPVIAMLRVFDAPGRRGDLFHYVVVDGSDPARRLLRIQFGDGEARWIPLGKLLKSWRPTGFALLVIRPAPEGGVRRASDLRHAVSLEESGRHDEAAAAYRALLSERPDSALLWTNLGNSERGRGRSEQAEAAYRRALELDPEHRDALNNLAWLLLEAGRLEEAERLARRAVAAAGPDPHYALDTLGRILIARGFCRDAIAAFTAGLEVAPQESAESAGLLLGRGLGERDCGDLERAAETLRAAIKAGAGSGVESEARAALAAMDLRRR